jgi:hypothetical protein
MNNAFDYDDPLPDDPNKLVKIREKLLEQIEVFSGELARLKRDLTSKRLRLERYKQMLASVDAKFSLVKPLGPEDYLAIVELKEKNNLTWTQLGVRLGVSTSRARNIYEKSKRRALGYGKPGKPKKSW